MSSEAQVRCSLQIKVGNLYFQNQPTQFVADVSVANGPTPGVVPVTITGVNIDLSKLTKPGFCVIQNLDVLATNPLNYVLIGPYDGVSFYPLIELLPGETCMLRLYRYLGGEFLGTGTNADTNFLRAMSYNASCKILVQAFEK